MKFRQSLEVMQGYRPRDFQILYVFHKKKVRFYLNSEDDKIYFQVEDKALQLLADIPHSLQVAFFEIFIQNHSLSGKLSVAQNSIQAIEAYIRSPELHVNV